MKYRDHRGSLDASMQTVVEVEGREQLIAHLRRQLSGFPEMAGFQAEAVQVQPYHGDDHRIGWKDVHVVTIDGYGVMGFCEGPIL